MYCKLSLTITQHNIRKLLRKISYFFRYNLYVKPKLNKVVREKIHGYTFIVRPSVFNPKDFISSVIFTDHIRSLNLKGKNIMDMGSGSGVVCIFAASKGADCTAVDINPIAIRCIKENAERNGLDRKINAIESDLFLALRSDTKIQYRFDIIFFNPPYYKGIPKNNFERAFLAGADLDVIDNFLAEAKNFLLPRGKICFIVSSDMDLADLENRFKKSGYSFEVIKTIQRSLETFYIIESVTI